jgi:ribonucleoside-triphosphate reductase
MSIRALQDYTYYSKYARFNQKAKRRETWNEAVDRVFAMHLEKYPHCQDEIEWAVDLVKNKRVLGSQRALQFGGEPIKKKNARMYNCTVSFCDRLRFFQECFWLLLCGCGTGFSVQKHHIAKIPAFSKKIGTKGKKTFVVPDTIEGWADALGVLIGSFFPFPEFKEWEGHDVVFDYSLIRPAGSVLASGVGKAPGPEPLKRSLEIIQDLLEGRSEKFDRLRPIDAYDIVMHASDAVLSGGVRRSATICIFSFDDEEMASAKTGNWFNENPQRGRSNNSALLLRGEITREQFNKLMESVKEYGEPGFYWSDSTEQLPNPCVEIGMWPVDILTGESGWQFCNLCEINGRKIKCKEDFALAARGAAIVGTLQAGYDKFDYLGEVTERIVRREALLGVSITGMQDNPEVIFDEKTQREMAKLVLETNEWMAKKIGIQPAARATCVKPAGTTSCILGTGSGIHPHHAKRYFRRVQANSMEPVLQWFKKTNPHAVETSVWSANKTDEVITFCVEVPDGAKTKNDLNAIELLELVKKTQQNWVSAGKRADACTQEWLTHNVSNTINVRADEWEAVANFIYDNRKWFAGVSLLPSSGDLDYPQAPMCNVLNPKEILAAYGDGALLASGLIVDGLHAFKNNLWKACDAVNGLGDQIEDSETDKLNWIRRVKQFADRYCDGDVRKCCYLMKHVNNWKTWLDLKREYADVDYTQLIEETDETKPMDTVACAGGACEISFHK